MAAIPVANAGLGSRPRGMPGSYSAQVVRYGQPGGARFESDELADEVAVALEYNGLSHAALLASPTHLEDLALGFSYTEGIIRSAADIYEVDVVEQAQGWTIQLRIAAACLTHLKLRRRQMAGRTGCGLCGLETLSQVQRRLPPLADRSGAFSGPALLKAASQLRASQPLHVLTGATHGAAWATPDGDVVFTREDVGRHNALDKLIGLLLHQEIDTSSGFALVSSRASFEMVQKAAAAGISALIAVSAPTSYAVRMANDLNILLAGFVREDRFTIYSHPEFLADQRSLS